MTLEDGTLMVWEHDGMMEIAAACAREILSRCRRRKGAVGYVGAGAGGYSVFVKL